jgi:hypothetical protein
MDPPMTILLDLLEGVRFADEKVEGLILTVLSTLSSAITLTSSCDAE